MCFYAINAFQTIASRYLYYSIVAFTHSTRSVLEFVAGSQQTELHPRGPQQRTERGRSGSGHVAVSSAAIAQKVFVVHRQHLSYYLYFITKQRIFSRGA